MFFDFFRTNAFKFVFLLFLVGCGSTEVSDPTKNSVQIVFSKSTVRPTATDIINGYPITMVIYRDGVVLSESQTVSVSLSDFTSGCGGSGAGSKCLRLQSTSGSNSVSVNSYPYVGAQSTIYVGAHASVAAQNISISNVVFAVSANVTVDGVQTSASTASIFIQ